ncbi:acetylcholine receptor subunit alpha-L1-like [Branchiostoma floridae x Branchiostoma belcheri]
MCGEENSCLLAWRWCDGGVDCTDGKDEENCECWTIPGDFNNSRLAMLPNQLGHKTFEEIQNSSVAELLNFNSNPEGFHPEFGQFVSTILYPRCNVSEENMCSSSENADDICTGKLLLPCRSWCEEVFNTADDRIKNLLPGCDVFPPPQHGCWHPEPDIKNKEVCYYGSGSNYRGTGSTTLSGAACVEWTAAQGGFYTTEYPWANLVHNYCRNPTGLERPFCITEDGSQEECDLIPCNAAGCLDLGPPNYGRRSPGKRFYFVGERVAFTCNEGYSIKSGYTNEVRCIGNGRWEYVKPICSVNMRGRLEKELLEVYSPNLAPERNVLIGFTGFVEQIVDLDEKKEQLIASVVFQFTWHDSRLGWDPKYYDGIDVFSVPGSGIWTPALNLKRNADPSYTGLEKGIPVQVNNTGVITWRVETLTTTVCDADPFYFPVDTMECHICFSATAAIGQTIQCGNGNSTEDYSSSLSCDASPPAIQEGEWYRKDRFFAKSNEEACFAVQLERIPSFHIATTIGPCVILVVLMVITFVMPLDRGDRISFGVTIQLSMVVSLVFVTDVLPVKGALPFFATLIVVYMALMGVFLFFTMGVITIHDMEGSLSPILKTFFLRYMARMLLMGDLTKKNGPSDVGETDLTSDSVIDLTIEDKKSLFGEDPAIFGTKHHPFAPDMTETILKKTGTCQGIRRSAKLFGDVPSRVTAKPTEALETPGPAGFLQMASSVKELATAVNNQTQELGNIIKAMKNEEEVSDYTLLAKVLDRLCLVLYVICISAAVPATMYLGK